MTTLPRAREPDLDPELVARVSQLLDDLEPVPEDAPRERKWRTTEQIAYLLLERWAARVSVDHLERVLEHHEAVSRERLRAGLSPEARLRRATYPDRTTALPLWGSTMHRGQPWAEQPGARRVDPPDDLPAGLEVRADAPRVFLSHTHHDAERAIHVARALAALAIGVWIFEVHIGHDARIATCVREALCAASGCVALVTRDSLASLWMLTELHTAMGVGRPVVLVVDAEDDDLLQLLMSVRVRHPELPFDCSVEYDRARLAVLHADYARRHSPSRADRYLGQSHDFLATLPSYLGGAPALACAPPRDGRWPLWLRPLDDLRARLGLSRSATPPA